MHIAHVIVKSRAILASAEAHYGTGHKGTSSEILAELSGFLKEELPGIDLSATIDVEPSANVEDSKESDKDDLPAAGNKPAAPQSADSPNSSAKPTAQGQPVDDPSVNSSGE